MNGLYMCGNLSINLHIKSKFYTVYIEIIESLFNVATYAFL
jgi:hypothetical protein